MRQALSALLLLLAACAGPPPVDTKDPASVARAFVDAFGVVQPAPAPRFSRTVPAIERPPAHDGQHTVEVLHDWSIAEHRVQALIEAGAVRQA